MLENKMQKIPWDFCDINRLPNPDQKTKYKAN